MMITPYVTQHARTRGVVGNSVRGTVTVLRAIAIRAISWTMLTYHLGVAKLISGDMFARLFSYRKPFSMNKTNNTCPGITLEQGAC